MDKNIKTIGLIVKNNEQSVIDNLQRLYNFLSEKEYQILLDESTENLLENTQEIIQTL